MKKWRKTSEIPFHLVHLNERPEEVTIATEGKTPCIVGKSNSGFVMLATDEELTSFDGSVDLLKRHIERQLTENPNPTKYNIHSRKNRRDSNPSR